MRRHYRCAYGQSFPPSHHHWRVYTSSQPPCTPSSWYIHYLNHLALLLLSSIECHLVCVQSRLQIAHSPRSVRFRGSKRPPHSLGKSEYIASSASQSPFPSIAEIKYGSKSDCSIWAGQLLKLHSNTILPPMGNPSTNRCRASSSPYSMASANHHSMASANHSKATGSPRSELSNRPSSRAMGSLSTVSDRRNRTSNNHRARNSLSSRLTGSQHHHRVTTDSLPPNKPQICNLPPFHSRHRLPNQHPIPPRPSPDLPTLL
jgi:hypothetical protein